jgi:hypothetical protein
MIWCKNTKIVMIVMTFIMNSIFCGGVVCTTGGDTICTTFSRTCGVVPLFAPHVVILFPPPCQGRVVHIFAPDVVPLFAPDI